MNVHARPQDKKIDKKDACPECLRPVSQCFCKSVDNTKQHNQAPRFTAPQEQYKLLNSARLTHTILGNSMVRVGLSWRNFRHALGEDADPKLWGALFLKPNHESARALEIFDAKKRPVSPAPHLQGLLQSTVRGSRPRRSGGEIRGCSGSTASPSIRCTGR